MLAAAAVAGFVIRSFCKNRQELQAAREFRNRIIPDQDDQLQALTDEHIKVLENKTLRMRNIVFLSVGILACASAAFAGGMLGISWLITASIIAGVVTGSAGVFLICYHWDDKTDLSEEKYSLLLDLQQRYPAPIPSATPPPYSARPPAYNPDAPPPVYQSVS